MNVRCDPDKGGCGTLFTVGAISCPNCQRPAEKVGTANIEGLQPRELDEIIEPEPEPKVVVKTGTRRRSGGDQNEQNSNDTNE